MTKTTDTKSKESNNKAMRRFYFPSANNGNGASILAESREAAEKILEARNAKPIKASNNPSA